MNEYIEQLVLEKHQLKGVMRLLQQVITAMGDMVPPGEIKFTVEQLESLTPAAVSREKDTVEVILP